MFNQRFLASIMLASVLLGPASFIVADANAATCQKGDTSANCKTFWQRNPYIKSGLIGAGVGGAGGVILSRSGKRGSGAVKGAAIGAGAGLGYQYLKNRGVFDRKKVYD